MSAHITLDGATPLCCTHGAGGWPGEPIPPGLEVTRVVEHVTCGACWAQVPDRARWTLAYGHHCVDSGCQVVEHFTAHRMTNLAAGRR